MSMHPYTHIVCMSMHSCISVGTSTPLLPGSIFSCTHTRLLLGTCMRSWYKTVARLGFSLLGTLHYCRGILIWYAATRPIHSDCHTIVTAQTNHRNWHNTVSVSIIFLVRRVCWATCQIRLRAEGPLRKEAAGFPVEGPVRAAAAALMGMVK